MLFRVGRGRRPAVDFVVCFGRGVFFRVFSFDFFCLERTRPAASMRPTLASLTSLLVMRMVFGYRQESLFLPGCGQDRLSP